MIFNNKAALKLLGVESTKDLHGLLAKPLFVNREHGNVLSLLATAKSRYSEDHLGQAYIFKSRNSSDADSSNSLTQERIICF